VSKTGRLFHINNTKLQVETKCFGEPLLEAEQWKTNCEAFEICVTSITEHVFSRSSFDVMFGEEVKVKIKVKLSL
jgi:hypothetical protein